MKTALKKLTERIRRTQSIEYVRMLESCVDEYPHFHLLARTEYIKFAWLQERWKALTGAHRVNIQVAKGKSVGYVAKYLNKARDEDGAFGRQRVGVTQGFWQDRDPEWEFLGFDHRPMHPAHYAADKPEVVFHRRKHGTYTFEDREPGDENPPELQLAWPADEWDDDADF